MIAMADLACGQWPELARHAAVVLTTDRDQAVAGSDAGRAAGDLGEVAKLGLHDVGAADHLAQGGLAEDGPERERVVASEDLLPGEADLHELFSLALAFSDRLAAVIDAGRAGDRHGRKMGSHRHAGECVHRRHLRDGEERYSP